MTTIQRSNRHLLIKNGKMVKSSDENLSNLAEAINETQLAVGPSDNIRDFIKGELAAKRAGDLKYYSTTTLASLTFCQALYLSEHDVKAAKFKLALCGVAFIAECLLLKAHCDKFESQIDGIRKKLNIFRINRGLPGVAKPLDYPYENKKAMKKIKKLNHYNPYPSIFQAKKGA